PLAASNRDALLRAIAGQVKSAYVPALYRTETLADGTVVVAGPAAAEAPFPIERRIIADFSQAPQVMKPVVPIHESVHERAVVEIMRGCPNGCRFCQAGFVTRPLRERNPEQLRQAALACLAATGYDEVGLLSLSTSNYSRFDQLLEELDRDLAPRGISLSLPSLRVDHALSGIPARIASVRKSGLTVAPEAGSDRLRMVINKDVKNEDLIAAAAEAFQRNWRQIKLYFMLGLPTETEEDVIAIAELAEAAARTKFGGGGGPGKGRGKGGGRPVIHVSASNFVPKPFTPFQWHGAAHPDVWQQRRELLTGKINRRLVAFHSHDVNTSLLEAAFSRGDRRLGAVILSAWKKGARLDAWTEHFRPGLWMEAFRENGLDPVRLATRDIDPAARLPWEHIDCGVAKSYLLRERERALAVQPTPACGTGQCAGCGAPGCTLKMGAG
ncbi:MAG: radical SAM protein, partial [Planctomycetes bacterium]|nr:radical SAM protein [Planctomycetota bacterium]